MCLVVTLICQIERRLDACAAEWAERQRDGLWWIWDTMSCDRGKSNERKGGFDQPAEAERYRDSHAEYGRMGTHSGRHEQYTGDLERRGALIACWTDV